MKSFKQYTTSPDDSSLDEKAGVPVHQYKTMLKWFEDSDEREVFDLLDRAGFRIPKQGFPVVQHAWQKHRNAKKAAADIMKQYPKFQKA